MWPFMTGFFQLAQCFWGSFMLQVSELHFFLLPNNIQLYGYTIFCLTIHQIMGISVVNTFCLLWMMLLMNIHVTRFYVDSVFNSFGYILGVELLVHMITLCSAFWGTAIIFFQSGCTILYSHQQCIKVPVSLPSCNQLLLSVPAPSEKTIPPSI